MLFVPAAGVKDAAIFAIEAGIKLSVLVLDRVPVWDAMEIAASAKANGAMFVGPNTLGVLSPGKGVVGMIGGRAESARQWFKPGLPIGVGVISRSGGMASITGYYLGQAGGRLVILDLLSHRFERARELYADQWLGFSEVQLHQWLEEAGFGKLEVTVVSGEKESPHFRRFSRRARNRSGYFSLEFRP